MFCTYLVYNTNRYYDRKKSSSRKKRSSSHLSGRCAIVIMTGKKVLVICLADARSLLRPEKKVLFVCLAGARSLLRPEKKSSSRDFYAKLNVSNLNVTNLY